MKATKDNVVLREEPLGYQDEDRDLMAAINAGEKKAMEHLYDRYAGIVMGLAFKITDDRALAEEIVQDVFWRVWRQSSRFDGDRGAFSSWLLTMTRNMAIDAWRKTIKSLPTRTEVLETQLHTETHHTADAHWMLEREEQIRLAVNELPPEQRSVIEMAFFHGKTRREIAAETDTPLGTVHTRARLAMSKLRLSLEARGLGDLNERKD